VFQDRSLDRSLAPWFIRFLQIQKNHTTTIEPGSAICLSLHSLESLPATTLDIVGLHAISRISYQLNAPTRDSLPPPPAPLITTGRVIIRVPCIDIDIARQLNYSICWQLGINAESSTNAQLVVSPPLPKSFLAVEDL
jgi:hypothetical protein